MTRRLDLLDVAEALLEAAGMPGVTMTLADASKMPEATVITAGPPMGARRYWDGTGTTSQRLTVICKRFGEEAALGDATEASRIMRREGALLSANGSYRLVSCEAEGPRFVTWDPQGRWLYAFDATVTYEEL